MCRFQPPPSRRAFLGLRRAVFEVAAPLPARFDGHVDMVDARLLGFVGLDCGVATAVTLTERREEDLHRVFNIDSTGHHGRPSEWELEGWRTWPSPTTSPPPRHRAVLP